MLTSQISVFLTQYLPNFLLVQNRIVKVLGILWTRSAQEWPLIVTRRGVENCFKIRRVPVSVHRPMFLGSLHVKLRELGHVLFILSDELCLQGVVLILNRLLLDGIDLILK